MAVRHLSDSDFSPVIKKGITIVDFWASWCSPCTMLSPIFEDLSNEYKKITFAKVDTEEYPEIASHYEVMSIPCLIIFNNGKEAGRIIGFMPKDSLKQQLDSILRKI